MSSTSLITKGLKSEEAFERLVADVKEAIDEETRKQWSLSAFLRDRRSIGNFGTAIAMLICSFVLILCFFASLILPSVRLEARWLFEGLILAVLLVINVLLYLSDQRLLRLGRIRKLRSHLTAFKMRGVEHLAAGDSPFEFEGKAMPQTDCIRVKRDGAWTFLPVNVLVQGDIVTLVEGAKMPCEMERLSDKQQFARGDKQTKLKEEKSCMHINTPILDNDPDDREPSVDSAHRASAKYRLLSTPLVAILTEHFAFTGKEDLVIDSFDKMSDPLSPALPLQRAKRKARKVAVVILVVSLIVAVPINVIKAVVQFGNHNWLELILIRHVYLCLPLLFIAFLLLVRVLHAVGNGCTLALLHFLQTKDVKREAGRFYDDEDLEEQMGDSLTEKVPLTLSAEYSAALFLGSNRTIAGPSYLSCSAYSSSLFQQLGSVTLVCCIDQKGILSDGVSYVEKILFFEDNEPTILELSRELPDQNTPLSSFPGERYEAERKEAGEEGEEGEDVGGAVDQGAMHGIRFNDLSWRDHLNSLKPLGLNCLLNSKCSFGEYNECRSPMSLDSSYSIKIHDGLCMCALGQRIGFSRGALDNFYPVKEIYRLSHCEEFRSRLARGPKESATRQSLLQHAEEYGYDVFPEDPVEEEQMKEKRLYYMVSTAVQDLDSGSLQLFSKGNPSIVLESCASAWHGGSLAPLEEEQIQRVLNYEHQWSSYECLAFAYEPIDAAFFPYLVPDDDYSCMTDMSLASCSAPDLEIREANSVPDLRGGSEQIEVQAGATTSSPALPPHMSKKVASRRTRSTSLLLADAQKEEEASEGSKKALLQKVLSRSMACSETDHEDHQDEACDIEEVFKEMQQEQIFIGMVAMRQLPRYEVEDAIQTIRKTGTHFAFFSEDGARSSKLFAERLGLETDWNCSINLRDSEDQQHDNTPARLPRGIGQIKTHLAEVDDVPLRTPLFYNSTKAACTEMIKLFQENGEVVCCVGSAFKAENLAPFQQSDIAIAFQPVGVSSSGCMTAECEADDISQVLLSSAYFLRSWTTDSFSVDTSTLPCSAILHQLSSIELLPHLIRLGRRFLANLEQSLLFYFGALLVLHFLLLFGYITFLPTPLHGTLILFLLLVTIPVLCVGLLLSPKGENEMIEINPKRNQEFPSATTFVVQRYLIQLVPMVFVLLFVFTIAFGGAWWTDGNFGGLFGFGPSASTTARFRAIRIAQNVAAFGLVIFLVVWAASFIQVRVGVYQSPKAFLSLPFFVAAVIVIVLQVLFVVIDINIALPQLLSRSLYPLLAVAIWCPIVLALDGLWKRRYNTSVDQEQQFMWLEFDTKLGMHSPVSPFL